MKMKRYSFPSRRSAVMSARGMVASSQPLATLAGVNILQQGGNAVDAAIATAAALNVVEPMMTGLGGDVFALVYLHQKRELRALNASGRAPYAASLETMRRLGYQRMPETGIHTVTVPGALDGWCTLLRACGTMSLSQVLEPAITLAEQGFPVSELTALRWEEGRARLEANAAAARTYLPAGRAPAPGEVFRQPDLASTFKKLAQGGRDVFYQGEIAQAIAGCSQENGGLITMQDLNDHASTWVSPISTSYRGYDIYQCPPNSQGLITLLALNILEGYDLKSLGHNSPEYLHLLIEALKLAFADAEHYVADPDFVDIPLEKLLSKAYAEQRRSLIDRNKALPKVAGAGDREGDTVYLAVVDKDGNSASFINSLYQGFGSGVVVAGTGVCLQNRGALFSLEPGHPNCIAPHKRPYHTIIPAMVFKDGALFLTFGVMGGFMQPQGQVQVLLNIIDFGMDVQTALDAPRFRYFLERNSCAFEPGFAPEVLQALADKGHRIIRLDDPYSQKFGGGQAIMVHPASGALIAGSDPRKDGCALGLW